MKKVSIMGILNVTPNSFSDGGIYYKNADKAVSRIQQMLNEGAEIIDVGGESTRPGAEEISVEEELYRVIPVIQKIRQKLGSRFILSIDTYKSHVAQEALKTGATMVNSMGGMTFDAKIADVIKNFKCAFVIYHIKGLPKDMQKGEIKYKDVVNDIASFFKTQIVIGVKNGIRKNQFIIDPGIGFGKTLEQNIEIIKRLDEFQKLQMPIMVGVSRKSHLGMLLQKKLAFKEIPTPQDRLEGSLAETAIAVMNGAEIIRTHDVLQTKRFLTVLEEFT